MALKLNQILVLCFLAVAVCQGERARYDNYRLYKVIATSAKELEILKNLAKTSDSIIFLNDVHHLNKPIKMVVAPHKVPALLEIIGAHKVDYELLEKNFQSQLENEVLSKFNPLARLIPYSLQAFNSLEDTYKWLSELVIEYPGVVSLIKGGKTYEGRPILGVKISKSLSEKPSIVIEAGLHAHEWIASATATFIINELLRSTDPGIQNITNNYNWYIFPHTNPDGYVYSHTTDRLWRKTRKPYGSCFGADPNRNWDFKWNVVGASNNSCSETYAGPAPFSEIETKTFSEYLKTLKDKIKLYISLHSSSQLLLYPYGYPGSLPANHRDLKQVAEKSMAAVAKRYGTKYTGGDHYKKIYPASGISTDWVYEILGTKMSFAYELPSSSNSSYVGFGLPASDIKPIGEEIVDSIVAMVNEVRNLGYFK